MTILNKTKISFHYGNAFSIEGMEKKAFATFNYQGVVDRELLDKVCELVRDHINESEGECCNIKISTEDWDC